MSIATKIVVVVCLLATTPSSSATLDKDCVWHTGGEILTLQFGGQYPIDGIFAVKQCWSRVDRASTLFLMSAPKNQSGVCKYDLFEFGHSEEPYNFMALSDGVCPDPLKVQYVHVNNVTPSMFSTIVEMIAAAGATSERFRSFARRAKFTEKQGSSLASLETALRDSSHHVRRIDRYKGTFRISSDIRVLLLDNHTLSHGFMLGFEEWFGSISLRTVDIVEARLGSGLSH